MHWENKRATGQTHSAKLILIQYINSSETRNLSIRLEQDYGFYRKQHSSYEELN